MALIVEKSEPARNSVKVPLLWLWLLILFWPGLIFYWLWKRTYFVCGNCGNRIADRGVKVCPVCKSELEYK